MAYVLELDPDRLLAGFRSEAGLIPRAPKYPNWESEGLDGHTLGHYLTAVAQLWAGTNSPELKHRLDYTIGELAACQQAQGNGYLGAVPNSRKLWADLAAGRFDAQGFSLQGAWVPWYNVHKTFAGLRDAWLIGKNERAREILIRLSEWCDQLVSTLTDKQMQAMLRTEHGGMNEVLADVAAITAERRYLQLARRFSHREILEPLLRHEDKLTGLHANTQIPKVIGFARIAELDPTAVEWLDAAHFFWKRVTGTRTVAFGGNSVREHFNPPDDFSAMIESREGPETCNTYNMLRLTEHLFRNKPTASLADFYERALFNHILSSQHPDTGGMVYFTPIRPRHYRVYSHPTTCFWCCVGSGMESHSKYGRFIYAHDDKTLFVNLFIASKLQWRERGLILEQRTNFPDEPATHLTLTLTQPERFEMRIRHPAWVAPDTMKIRINGEHIEHRSFPGSYVRLSREWRHGDRVDINLPMHTSLEPIPDRSGYFAILHGPIVLAAKTDTADLDGLVAGDTRMGHVAAGPYRPLNAAPMLVGEPDQLVGRIVPVKGKPLTFRAPDLIRPELFANLELIPFFRVHDARYMLYWKTTTADGYEQAVKALKRQEQQRLELERMTVDQISPGQQQPEVEHHYRGKNSSTGTNAGHTWRSADGWFSYDLRTGGETVLDLQFTTFGRDSGVFTILIDGHELTTIAVDGVEGERFIRTSHRLPETVGETFNIRFQASPGSHVPPIYDIRLVKAPEVAVAR